MSPGPLEASCRAQCNVLHCRAYASELSIWGSSWGRAGLSHRLQVLDVVLDLVMALRYLRQGLYVFASLTFAIPPLAGSLSFMYRRTVWTRAEFSDDTSFFFQGLDRDGHSRPGIKDMILSCLHIRPVLTAWGVIAGGSKPCDWYLEKAFEGTFEGCPSALLQAYAWLCREHQALGTAVVS